MQQHRVISIIAASIACAWAPLAAHGQTTTGATSGTSVTTSGTTATTGTTATGTTTASGTTTTATGTTTTATTAAQSETRYLTRLQSQYPTLTSQSNMQSLVHGLRTGSAITLTGTQGTTATSTTFAPPTRPMGYGNITRALTLATRQLAAAGIANPTPQQLQTALMGGALTTATGTVQMQGVLQLRSQGMGWGQIAHTVGVQPGMSSKSATTASATTASGTRSSGITTATGASATGTTQKSQHVTEYRGRGIVTAAGTTVGGGSYRSQGSENRSGGAIIAANGATASNGVVSGAGSGQGSGGARSHGGKH